VSTGKRVATIAKREVRFRLKHRRTAAACDWIDELSRPKTQAYLTVVCDLEAALGGRGSNRRGTVLQQRWASESAKSFMCLRMDMWVRTPSWCATTLPMHKSCRIVSESSSISTRPWTRLAVSVDFN
jgi:hypothetical protein